MTYKQYLLPPTDAKVTNVTFASKLDILLKSVQNLELGG